MKLQKKIVLLILVTSLLFVALTSVVHVDHPHCPHQCTVKVGVQDAEASVICRHCGAAANEVNHVTIRCSRCGRKHKK